MFPGGQLDMAQVLQQAQALQQQLTAAQDELARTQVEGTSGGGLVAATVTGSGELVALSIDPRAVVGDDPAEVAETVADLVLAAVRDAAANAADLQQQAMGPLTQGLGAGLADTGFADPGLAGPEPAGPPGLPGR